MKKRRYRRYSGSRLVIIRGDNGASILVFSVFCLIFSLKCWAAGPNKTGISITEPQRLTLTVGKSIIVDVPEAVVRVSIAEPEVADVLILTPRQIYITGESSGVTNLTLWRTSDRISSIYDIEVMPDVTLLKERLHELFPQEKDIYITSTHDIITLSGMVSSAASLSRIMEIASSYAPRDDKGKPKLNNLLEVGGVHQVMLEVTVSEISRSLIKKLGINFNRVGATGQEYGISVLDNLSSLDSVEGFPLQMKTLDEIFTKIAKTEAFPVKPLGVSNSVSAIFRFLDGSDTWTMFIAALKDQGMLKILAEPTLITLSGKPASFLAGGEFPIPIPSTSGLGTTITIDYKQFGVSLQFTPTVLNDGKINMEVAPEVSALDFANALSFGGYVVPALTTRRVSTVVELDDGQSFAVAGLLRDDVREIVRKFPMLGDIPVLGALFRSSSFQKDETELIVVVTPHLVKPLDMAKQTLPTDSFIEPDDFEFYLLGAMEGRENELSTGHRLKPGELQPGINNKEGGLEGDFGHIYP